MAEYIHQGTNLNAAGDDFVPAPSHVAPKPHDVSAEVERNRALQAEFKNLAERAFNHLSTEEHIVCAAVLKGEDLAQFESRLHPDSLLRWLAPALCALMKTGERVVPAVGTPENNAQVKRSNIPLLRTIARISNQLTVALANPETEKVLEHLSPEDVKKLRMEVKRQAAELAVHFKAKSKAPAKPDNTIRAARFIDRAFRLTAEVTNGLHHVHEKLSQAHSAVVKVLMESKHRLNG